MNKRVTTSLTSVEIVRFEAVKLKVQLVNGVAS